MKTSGCSSAEHLPNQVNHLPQAVGLGNELASVAIMWLTLVEGRQTMIASVKCTIIVPTELLCGNTYETDIYADVRINDETRSEPAESHSYHTPASTHNS